MFETTEALTLTDTEIDAAWDDIEVEATDDGEQEPVQPEADQPNAEEPVKEETTETKEPEAEPTETDQPLSFTLKHLDEVRTVDKDEVVKLAQQGMDYERVKTERDQLRTYRNEADPALSFLKSYADKQGMSITDYVDYCRKQELLASGINEETATAQVAVEKQRAELNAAREERDAEQARERAQADAIQKQADARKADLARFFTKYPTVDPNSIPKEVWDSVAKGDSLVTAYTDHRNKQLEAELAAERQNKANTQTTTGSLSTSGAGTVDEIDKWWNDD